MENFKDSLICVNENFAEVFSMCRFNQWTNGNSRPTSSEGGQPLAVYVLSALAAIGGFLFGYDTGVGGTCDSNRGNLPAL